MHILKALSYEVSIDNCHRERSVAIRATFLKVNFFIFGAL
jgi:hypothetical protein